MNDQPWKTEPDQLDLVLNGFRCEIKRSPTSGALLGYIDLPEGHPLFMHEYDGVEVPIHGGWTFSAMHPSGAWRIGFDCSHYSDLKPRFLEEFGIEPLEFERYRTLDYVGEELSRASDDLFQMMSAHQKMEVLAA